MRKLINFVVLLIIILNFSGCATIFKPKDQTKPRNSDSQGATLSFKSGGHGTLPKLLGLDKDITFGH